MSDFIQWLGSRLKKDDSKVGAEETFEAGRKLGKKEEMERIAELEEIERRWNNIQPQHVIMIGDTGHYVNTAVHDRIAELEQELDICMKMGKDVCDSRNEYKAERDKLRDALQEIADEDFKGRAAHIAWGALEVDNEG